MIFRKSIDGTECSSQCGNLTLTTQIWRKIFWSYNNNCTAHTFDLEFINQIMWRLTFHRGFFCPPHYKIWILNCPCRSNCKFQAAIFGQVAVVTNVYYWMAFNLPSNMKIGHIKIENSLYTLATLSFIHSFRFYRFFWDINIKHTHLFTFTANKLCSAKTMKSNHKLLCLWVCVCIA